MGISLVNSHIIYYPFILWFLTTYILLTSKIQSPMRPQEWTVLFLKTPRFTFCGLTLLPALETPLAALSRRYQYPKWVPPATQLLLTVLFGFVTQNAAGVRSSFNKLELALTNTAKLLSNVLLVSTPRCLFCVQHIQWPFRPPHRKLAMQHSLIFPCTSDFAATEATRKTGSARDLKFFLKNGGW